MRNVLLLVKPRVEPPGIRETACSKASHPKGGGGEEGEFARKVSVVLLTGATGKGAEKEVVASLAFGNTGGDVTALKVGKEEMLGDKEIMVRLTLSELSLSFPSHPTDVGGDTELALRRIVVRFPMR